MHGVGNDPTYNAKSCFETFAFPDTGMEHSEAIAHAAQRLNELRERWLNPPQWTRREPEVVPVGIERSPYPDRILPREGFEKQLATRTLTKLYTERPAWLAQAHEVLDAAVAAAYGWADYPADAGRGDPAQAPGLEPRTRRLAARSPPITHSRTARADPLLQPEQPMETEVLFNVEEADEGGYVATAALHGIVTEGDSIEELQARVRDAVACHFDAAEKPKLIRLHFVSDVVLAT